MRYRMDQIEALKVELAMLPAVDSRRREVTKQEAVRQMASMIESLRRRGYTFDDIAEILTARGFQIAGGTLRSCFRRSKVT